MKEERRKVLEMLSDGCITAEEAQLLLDTLIEIQTEAKNKTEWDFLLDLRGLKKESNKPTPPPISWQPV